MCSYVDNGEEHNRPSGCLVERDVLVERDDLVQGRAPEDRDEVAAHREEDERDVDVQHERGRTRDRFGSHERSGNGLGWNAQLSRHLRKVIPKVARAVTELSLSW